MMVELQQLLLDQWDDFQFNLPRPAEISIIQRSSAWRTGQGKIVQLLFRRHDRQPFAVAKFAQNEAYRHGIVREFEQLRWLRQNATPEFNGTLPRPLWLGQIRQQTVYLESACPGQSLSHLLSTKPFFFRRKVTQAFELAVDWLKAFYGEISLPPVALTEQEIQQLFLEPLDRFRRQFELSMTEERLLNSLQSGVMAHCGQRLPLVPSHGDFGGGAILIHDRQIAVIDWEFFQPRCLPLFDLFKLFIHPGVALFGSKRWGMQDQFRALFELTWYADLAGRLIQNLCTELQLTPELVGILFPLFLIHLIEQHDADRSGSDQRDAGWRPLFAVYADGWAEHKFKRAPWLTIE